MKNELFIDPNLEFLRRAQKILLWSFCIYVHLRVLRGVSAYYAEYPSLSHFIIRGWILCVYAQNITSGVEFFRARPQIFHVFIVWIYLVYAYIPHVVLCIDTQNRKSRADFFCVRPQIFHAYVMLFGMSAYVRRKSEMLLAIIIVTIELRLRALYQAVPSEAISEDDCRGNMRLVR